MGEVLKYITENFADLIKDSVFAIIGVVLGLIFTPKNNSSQTSNGSSIQQTMQIIYQNVIVNNNHNNHHHYKPKKKRSSNEDDNSELGIWIIGIALVSFLFVKYHEVIMYYFTGFIVLALASTLTIAIKLHMSNHYDNLNRFWTAVSLAIIIVDCVTLVLMSKQDTASITTTTFSDFIGTAGIKGVLRYGYYALGFLLAQLPNLLLLVLLLHMYSVNSYLANGGRVSAFIIRKSSPFTIKPVQVTVVATVVCVMSLLFTSGVLFDWVSKIQNNNTTITTAQK